MKDLTENRLLIRGAYAAWETRLMESVVRPRYVVMEVAVKIHYYIYIVAQLVENELCVAGGNS